MPAPTSRGAADPITATVPTPAPHLAIYQQHCIERILTRAVGKSEEAVVREITQLCLAPHPTTLSAAAGSIVLACGHLFGVPFTPVIKPVAGCLGG